eukprot:1115203-Prorocentrum_minimum.AAC.1
MIYLPPKCRKCPPPPPPPLADEAAAGLGGASDPELLEGEAAEAVHDRRGRAGKFPPLTGEFPPLTGEFSMTGGVVQ